MIKRTAAAAGLAACLLCTAVNANAQDTEIFLSHSTGYYDNTQFVTVINSGDSEIFFTTDGSDPEEYGTAYSGEPIVIEENTVVRMAAYSAGELVYTDRASLKIRTGTPFASKDGGRYTDTVKVKLSCPEDGAEIYYTTDGTVPTKDSEKYKKTLTISETTTLKFAAYAPGKSRSRVVTEKYVISENEFDDPMSQKLFELVNETRAEYGLKPLKTLPELTEAAEIRAEEYSYYRGHYRPDGSKWDTILAAYGLKRNVRSENLAYYYTTAKGALKCWMSDPYHRGNILDPNAEYIGIGYYNNGWCSYWSQLFIGGE